VLFSDRFLFAVPADDPLPERARVNAERCKCTPFSTARRRPLFARSGADLLRAARYAQTRLRATNLATVSQMVASGYGVTLLPEVAVDVEVRSERVKLLRFVEPQPQRLMGLAWRPTSPRKADFLELGQILLKTLKCEQSLEMREQLHVWDCSLGSTKTIR
jgi:LysR family transcriptional regulator, hydrogen peroxide-inducible genes activator